MTGYEKAIAGLLKFAEGSDPARWDDNPFLVDGPFGQRGDNDPMSGMLVTNPQGDPRSSEYLRKKKPKMPKVDPNDGVAQL